jgi:DNA polymerase-1
MSGDATMIETFKAGGDIHRATAAKINNVSPEEVTKEMRSAAKAINFGLLYGQGPHGLAQITGISYADAKKFIDAYFTSFSSIKNYMDQVLVEARSLGYVKTLLGRKRYLPDIKSSVMMIAKSAERAAINAPIQGTAADMIKLAMIKVDAMLEDKYAGKVKMIMQVHDELVFEVNKSLVSELTAAIKPLMENVLELSVPILVDAKVGENWEEMEPIK